MTYKIANASVLHNLTHLPESPCRFLQITENCFYTFDEEGNQQLWSKNSWGYETRLNSYIKLGFSFKNVLYLVVMSSFNEIYFPVTPSNFHKNLTDFLWEVRTEVFFDPQFWSVN